MKRICLLVICALALVVSASAQNTELATVTKTSRGYVVVSNEPGNYYSAVIKGNAITQDPDCPVCLMVDQKPFEMLAVPKKVFLKDPAGLDDMALLVAYKNWETNRLSDLYDEQFNPTTVWIKLADGNRAVVWNYDKPPRFEGDTDIVSRFALATVKGDHLLLMDISVDKNSDAQKTQQFLVDTMNTVRTSDKKITIEQVRAVTR
jgi:hypothetical protein